MLAVRTVYSVSAAGEVRWGREVASGGCLMLRNFNRNLAVVKFGLRTGQVKHEIPSVCSGQALRYA
jgi:hypothetical protein